MRGVATEVLVKEEGMRTGASRFVHEHGFVPETVSRGERRTRVVVVLTFVMMVVEIFAGSVFGSMALLADGWHMGTHAAALGIAAFAYAWARGHAHDPRYSFGTGKVGALGGFASAVGLAVVALMVFGESGLRLLSPTEIHFDEALVVAVVGLAVNLLSAALLGVGHEHGGGGHHHPAGDGHGDHHGHGHEDHDRSADGHADHGHGHAHDLDDHRDHNLRGAYLHVLADALTSVLAIGALLAGKVFGWGWLDPMIGIVGSIVIARWSWGLLRDTSAVLLDAEAGGGRLAAIRRTVEADGETSVTDLHVWRVGPSHLAAIVSVASPDPREPEHYRALLAHHEDLVHVTVEVNRTGAGPA